MHEPLPETLESVWILEDEPAAAALVAEVCRAGNLEPRLFREPQRLLRALDEAIAPAVIILDWRLQHELSAPLFLAARHRFPRLPVVFWTASELGALPVMVRRDPLTRVVPKPSGIGALESALTWALGRSVTVGMAAVPSGAEARATEGSSGGDQAA